ncbi:MAG: alkaline phosphatase D family protein [Actinopolymorphaceae bacterium]
MANVRGQQMAAKSGRGGRGEGMRDVFLRSMIGRRRAGIERRALIAATLGGLGMYAAGFSHAKAEAAPLAAKDDPFTLGVASGDPQPDGVVLWTRLAPEPLALDGSGGMADQRVNVRWELARDEHFKTAIKEGQAPAVPELGHSVHVEVNGLKPGREYFYRFRTGGFESPVGRTRTAPASSSDLQQVRFGVASCQVWWGGFYSAFKHLAEDDLDVVFHLGDYIYENVIPADGLHRKTALPTEIRNEPLTLAEYRNRHALFRTDPDLQAAHAAVPFVHTWDDHEVDDNWAGDISRDVGQDPAEFRLRRAAAAQAYYENLPLRLPQKPNGADITLYRKLTYGKLATFHVLDGRMFRDDQACGDGAKADCEERLDPARTMLGFGQEDWLHDGVVNSGTTWNILANQVPMTQCDLDTGAPLPLFMDAWDGYKPARDRLFQAFTEGNGANAVVISGDRHRHMASDLKANFDDPDSRTVAVEFTGTSVTSGQDGADLDEHDTTVLAANPHVKFMSSRRGYVRMTVTPDRCQSDHLVMPYVSTPGAPISTRATLVTEAGNPGLQLDTESRT